MMIILSSSKQTSVGQHQLGPGVTSLQLNIGGNILTLSLERGNVRLLDPGRSGSPGDVGVVEDGVGERDVDVVHLVVLGSVLIHLVESVLENTHLPHILGRVRFIKLELDTVLVLLTLDAKVFLVVDQVCDLIPLEQLRLLTIPLPQTDSNQTWSQQHFIALIIFG